MFSFFFLLLHRVNWKNKQKKSTKVLVKTQIAEENAKAKVYLLGLVEGFVWERGWVRVDCRRLPVTCPGAWELQLGKAQSHSCRRDGSVHVEVLLYVTQIRGCCVNCRTAELHCLVTCKLLTCDISLDSVLFAFALLIALLKAGLRSRNSSLCLVCSVHNVI